MNLTTKTMLITGASSGIGRATAVEAARRGATVRLVARREHKLQDAADEIRLAGGSATVHVMDLSDGDAVKHAVDVLLDAHGPPDIVINNAGAGRWLTVEETSPSEAVSMMGAPYFAAFFLSSYLIPAMRERGSGWFLQVNSPACLVTFPGATGYSASRAALRAFSHGLDRELRGTGIGVTHLIAGETSSNYFESNPNSHERIPGLAKMYPLSTPETVAKSICDAIERERRHVVMPWLLRVTCAIYEITPWMIRTPIWATAWRS
ncbi:MAG: short-subunit dehydrogenase [Kiritimatiellia bacterium]|jgi:short-subunit dehydrogenase